MKASFIRAGHCAEDQHLLKSIGGIRDKCFALHDAYLVDPRSFLQIPNAVCAYWVSEEVRRLFRTYPSFEQSQVTAKAGLCTGDDFRFVRLSWELKELDDVHSMERWVPFAKGGEFARYYSDVHLAVNWSRQGEQIIAGASTGTVPGARPQNTSFFFKPGITWPLRTTSEFGVRIMPSGCISGHKGPAAYTVPFDQPRLLALLALCNSEAFRGLLHLQLAAVDAAARSYEVGVIQRTVVPTEVDARLSELALASWSSKRGPDTANLASHAFILPALHHNVVTLADGVARWQALLTQTASALADNQRQIDDITYRLYGIGEQDRREIEQMLGQRGPSSKSQTISDEDDELGEEAISGTDASTLVRELLDYLVGCVFGRWDIRYATGERLAPDFPSPFAPLPFCPPGMLQDENGLPLSKEEGRRLRAQGQYPLDVVWDGEVVDDIDHPLDIDRRVHDAFAVIWGDRVDALEHEACECLSVNSLREYFRKPTGFFTDHLKRYSKSRRQAPIYWPLSTASASYSIWIYYHRFSKDTLYRVREVADEKLRHEERKLLSSQQDAGPNPSTKEAKALGEQAKFVEELREFRAEVARVLPLWNPDLNDGVIINFAPFHRLISHPKWRKDVTDCWDELVKGNYDWSRLAMHLWPERVIPKCATDLSLAIAHGLDETFWEPDPDKEGKYRLRGDDEMRKREIEKLLSERKKPAVRAALAEFQSLPTVGPARKRRKAKL